VLVVTSKDDLLGADAALQVGAYGYLIKPFEKE
jgi:response regulator of citrate/malate metabolism